MLRVPFEPIEIIKWRPKIRGENEDAANAVYGDEKWFTLDNRRLLALQKKALSQWPNRCLCEVRVNDEAKLMKRSGKHLRKFKTKKDGQAIDIGYRDEDIIETFDWRTQIDSKRVEDMDPLAMEEAMWYYVATSPGGIKTTQGPFEMGQMYVWQSKYPEYFTKILPVKLDWYLDFYPLNVLYSQKNKKTRHLVPFKDYPVHPPQELNSNRLQ